MERTALLLALIAGLIPAWGIEPSGPAASHAYTDILPTDVKPGEWVLIHTRIATGEHHVVEVKEKRTVLNVQGDGATRMAEVRREIESGGNSETATERRPIAAPSTTPDRSPVAEEKVRVGRQTMACRIHEQTRALGGGKEIRVRIWRCAEVPLDGTVRIEHDGKVVYELLEFGRQPVP